jgi:hypothetical protein
MRSVFTASVEASLVPTAIAAIVARAETAVTKSVHGITDSTLGRAPTATNSSERIRESENARRTVARNDEDQRGAGLRRWPEVCPLAAPQRVLVDWIRFFGGSEKAGGNRRVEGERAARMRVLCGAQNRTDHQIRVCAWTRHSRWGHHLKVVDRDPPLPETNSRRPGSA